MVFSDINYFWEYTSTNILDIPKLLCRFFIEAPCILLCRVFSLYLDTLHLASYGIYSLWFAPFILLRSVFAFNLRNLYLLLRAFALYLEHPVSTKNLLFISRTLYLATCFSLFQKKWNICIYRLKKDVVAKTVVCIVVTIIKNTIDYFCENFRCLDLFVRGSSLDLKLW